jgi:serine/threonine protein kinase
MLFDTVDSKVIIGGHCYFVRHVISNNLQSCLCVAEPDSALGTKLVLKKVSPKELDITRTVSDASVPGCITLLDSGQDEDGNHIAVFPYYKHGDLWYQLDKGAPTGFTEVTVRGLVTDLTIALLGLKKIGVAHHDVSLENVLISEDGKAMLTDFGLSVFDKDLEEKAIPPLSLLQGKLNYIGPELYFHPDQYHDLHKAHVWSLGVCVFMLLLGDMPYRNMGDDQFGDLGLYGSRLMIRDLERRRHHKLSEEAKLLIEQMLQVRPEKRVALEDILTHPFVTGRKMPDRCCWDRFSLWVCGLFYPR